MPSSQHDSFAMLMKDAALAVSFFAVRLVVSIVRIIMIRLCGLVGILSYSESIGAPV